MSALSSDSRQAIAAALFEEADGILTRLEQLQATLPALLQQLQSGSESAAASVKSALVTVEKATLPALNQALQAKAREVHTAMIAAVSAAARDVAVTALQGETRNFAGQVEALLVSIEATTLANRRQTSSRLYALCGVSAFVGASVALLVCSLVVGFR